MSSMRNAVQRRNHRERAQPLERQKWGLLEKHKDYSLRAKDHNTKKRKIKQLTDKARERNEDEFYFAMVNSSSEGGRKRARRDEGNGGQGNGLSHDVVRLMKTQDAGYLRTVLQHARAERKVVEEEVTTQMEIRRQGSMGKRMVFGEDGVVATLPETVGKGHMDFDDEDDAFEDLESDEDGLELDDAPKDETEDDKKKRHRLEVDIRKLRALKEREEQLSIALRELEDQRARMNGTVGGVNKHGVKFKVRQRKK
nr:u3 small nucleolar rna-associated protein 11 [Quercus suber]